MSRHGQLAVLVLLAALPLAAQTGLPFSGIPTGGLGNAPGISWSGAPRGGVVGPTPFRHGVDRFRRPFDRLQRPFFFGGAPWYYDDYDTSNSVIIENVVPAPERAPERVIEEPPPAALIIEREGNTWVRRRVATTAPGQSGQQTTAPEPQPLPERAPQPLTEATLIFRDGHRQNVAAYTIFGGALYYSMPAWAPQQRVLLSALDLPATISANRDQGIVFRLPNSPNEVVTRP